MLCVVGFMKAALLDRMESKVFHVISSSLMNDFLTGWFEIRRNVACLAIFHRYFQDNCSSQLASHMPPLLASFFFFLLNFTYILQASSSRVNHYIGTFIPYTATAIISYYFHLPTTLMPSDERRDPFLMFFFYWHRICSSGWFMYPSSKEQPFAHSLSLFVHPLRCLIRI